MRVLWLLISRENIFLKLLWGTVHVSAPVSVLTWTVICDELIFEMKGIKEFCLIILCCIHCEGSFFGYVHYFYTVDV